MCIKIHQFENNLIYNILDLIIVYVLLTNDSRELHNVTSTLAISYSRQDIGFVCSLE